MIITATAARAMMDKVFLHYDAPLKALGDRKSLTECKGSVHEKIHSGNIERVGRCFGSSLNSRREMMSEKMEGKTWLDEARLIFRNRYGSHRERYGNLLLAHVDEQAARITELEELVREVGERRDDE